MRKLLVLDLPVACTHGGLEPKSCTLCIFDAALAYVEKHPIVTVHKPYCDVVGYGG